MVARGRDRAGAGAGARRDDPSAAGRREGERRTKGFDLEGVAGPRSPRGAAALLRRRAAAAEPDARARVAADAARPETAQGRPAAAVVARESA